MLTRIDNNTVKGSQGYVVRIVDIHYVEYMEGLKVAIVEIEGGTDEYDNVEWLVYRDTLKGWESPYDGINMRDEDQKRILERISECMTLLKMRYKIV